MEKDDVKKYFKKCNELLTNDGIVITIVPASMKYWEIEDEIAGHVKRYEFSDFKDLADKFNYDINKINGLTFPISNLLLPISNHLVTKSESWKKNLDLQERTKLSSSGGARNVPGKTTFPKIFKYLLNEITMYPFYLLQIIFSKSKRSMIIYCELKKR